ncbi:MAG: hypothetical protein M1819_000923 [Sarea resinae]|nr:MAG: hypothetical protein M1819_000923 [Sarea resinae]
MPTNPSFDLAPFSLYILTYLERPTYAPDALHWVIYIYLEPAHGGMKLQIGQAGPRTTMLSTHHGPIKDVTRQIGLIGAVRVARLAPGSYVGLNRICQQNDDYINAVPGMNPRLYVAQTLERLKSYGLIKCDDVEALLDEIRVWSNANQQSAVCAVFPRPVVDSVHCRF